MTAANYEALREATQQLLAVGLKLQTVIPVALPAEEFPNQRRHPETGKWEPVQGKDGKPTPAFVGKNPSCWQPNGKPRKLSHRSVVSPAELFSRIDLAERLGKPIGIAVTPSTDLVVIDFDCKNYSDQQALDDDWTRLLDLYPELTRTRIERTPGGGVHIYVKPADGMASWRSSAGTFHCNFTTVPGGEHRVEVLFGTRVSVCAPTTNGAGGYELVNPDHAYSVVEIGSLGDIGISPVASSRGERTAPREEPKLTRAPAQQSPARSTPSLEALIGKKAKDVLEGGAPYCGGSGEGVDRSAQLTGFVKEIYSWINLLAEEGLAVRDTPEALIERAIAALGIEDKADRVLSGIESDGCCHANPEWALCRYQWLAGVRTKRWGRRAENRWASTATSTEADPADPGEPPLLSREECRDRLQDAVARHQSPT